MPCLASKLRVDTAVRFKPQLARGLGLSHAEQSCNDLDPAGGRTMLMAAG